MIKASIIVPVYNVENYLSMCLDSLINQTLKDIEIICINDGSTDNSGKILQQYAKKDSRIKVISQNNMGLSGARNTGLSLASGEYICFVDSDDWVDKDWCKKLYNAAYENDADIARAMILNEYPDNTTEQHAFNKTIENFVKNEKHLGINNHCVVAWNGIYKKDFLFKHHINFIYGLVHEDIPFTAKTQFYANKIIPVDNVFYHYRQNRVGQLSEINMKSLNGIFLANHYAMDFMNIIEYKNKTDYIDAIQRCIWRADNNFIQGLTNIPDFTEEKQLELFKLWQNDLKRCKYINKLKRHHSYISYVLKGNLKRYKRKRNK